MTIEELIEELECFDPREEVAVAFSNNDNETFTIDEVRTSDDGKIVVHGF